MIENSIHDLQKNATVRNAVGKGGKSSVDFPVKYSIMKSAADPAAFYHGFSYILINNKMYIEEAEVLSNLSIGNFYWVISESGTLTLKWSDD